MTLPAIGDKVLVEGVVVRVYNTTKNPWYVIEFEDGNVVTAYAIDTEATWPVLESIQSRITHIAYNNWSGE